MKSRSILGLFAVVALALSACPAFAERTISWQGYVTNIWEHSTANWNENGSPTAQNGASDAVQFGDAIFRPSTTNLNLAVQAAPVSVLFTNSNLSYTIGGTGYLSGPFKLTKGGTASLTIANTGVNTFSGGVAVNGGKVVFATDNSIAGGIIVAGGATLQVGTNGGTGTLPSGAMTNNGTLIFNRGASLTVANVISGAGEIRKDDLALLTLSGANTFTGAVSVAAGTLRVANASALGTTNGPTTITNNATLDLNGMNLGGEPVIVCSAGVGDNGAVLNSGPDQSHALRIVTLSGDTVFGGNGGRWDIRASTTNGNDATLSMVPPDSGYNLTKIGTNFVGLAGVVVDPSLVNVAVLQGTLGVEGATSLGSSGTLTVSNGATLEFFSNSVPITMMLDLNGDGVTTTVLNNGGSPVINAATSLNSSGGNVIFGGNGSNLNLDGIVTGSGSLVKNGAGQLTTTAFVSYTGTTIVNQGSLILDGFKGSGGGLTVNAAGTLGGGASIGEDVTVNGCVSPGNPLAAAQATLTIIGTLTLNQTTNRFELSNDPNGDNDWMLVIGDLNLTGINAFRIVPTSSLNVGDIYTLATYVGASVNVDAAHIVVLPPPGYAVTLIDPTTTTNQIRVEVTAEVPVLPPAPTITRMTVSGTSVVITGTNNNGATPGTYHVLCSTNLSRPLSNWTVLTNGSFSANGTFSSTNTLDAAAAFYIVEVP